jgi:hypothetical protein
MTDKHASVQPRAKLAPASENGLKRRRRERRGWVRRRTRRGKGALLRPQKGGLLSHLLIVCWTKNISMAHSTTLSTTASSAMLWPRCSTKRKKNGLA